MQLLEANPHPLNWKTSSKLHFENALQTTELNRSMPLDIELAKPQNCYSFPDISNRTAALLSMPKGRYQHLKRLQPLLANQSEDCLTLNIYVPGSGKLVLFTFFLPTFSLSLRSLSLHEQYIQLANTLVTPTLSAGWLRKVAINLALIDHKLDHSKVPAKERASPPNPAGNLPNQNTGIGLILPEPDNASTFKRVS
uniref:Uncharacterized protein n=1 Tax=Anopheles culicifacies TaxID=139723 RepID=A0A182MWK6_9DIPT